MNSNSTHSWKDVLSLKTFKCIKELFNITGLLQRNFKNISKVNSLGVKSAVTFFLLFETGSLVYLLAISVCWQWWWKNSLSGWKLDPEKLCLNRKRLLGVFFVCVIVVLVLSIYYWKTLTA